MLVTDGFSAGARASSPAELPMCSGTPAGQDARSPMLRRSRPFFAAKSARKPNPLTVNNSEEKQEVVWALCTRSYRGEVLRGLGLRPTGRFEALWSAVVRRTAESATPLFLRGQEVRGCSWHCRLASKAPSPLRSADALQKAPRGPLGLRAKLALWEEPRPVHSFTLSTAEAQRSMA